MKMENIEVGMKFSTVTKLYEKLGLNNVKGKQKQYQDDEIARYLSYKKTGKMSRGKETNEIIITEIYENPKPKIDNRGKHDNHIMPDKNSFGTSFDELILNTLSAYNVLDLSFTKQMDYISIYSLKHKVSYLIQRQKMLFLRNTKSETIHIKNI